MTFTPGDHHLKCHSMSGKYDDADDLVASGSTDKDIYAYLNVFASSLNSHILLLSLRERMRMAGCSGRNALVSKADVHEAAIYRRRLRS